MDLLPTEALLNIFKYLSPKQLTRLRQTCWRFNNIICEHFNLLYHTKNLLITNQINSIIKKRSYKTFYTHDLFRILHNWTVGSYDEKVYLRSSMKYMPFLQLSNDFLWHSRRSSIHAYDRRKLSRLNPILNRKYIVNCGRSDVTCFKIVDDVLISGQNDGSLVIWSSTTRKIAQNVHRCHELDINSLDFNNRLIATGSKDQCMKVFSFNEENALCGKLSLMFKREYEVDRVLSVALSPHGRYVAVGTTCYNEFGMEMFDTETMKMTKLDYKDSIPGSAIRDILWNTNHTLYSVGYDRMVRLWDIRVKEPCIQTWEDPFYRLFYCIDTDGSYALMSGCDMHGRVVLWDTRQNDFVQMYFMSSCKNESSPIYKLSFDVSQLFAATDRALTVLDFSSKTVRNIADYTYIKEFKVSTG